MLESEGGREESEGLVTLQTSLSPTQLLAPVVTLAVMQSVTFYWSQLRWQAKPKPVHKLFECFKEKRRIEILIAVLFHGLEYLWGTHWALCSGSGAEISSRFPGERYWRGTCQVQVQSYLTCGKIVRLWSEVTTLLLRYLMSCVKWKGVRWKGNWHRCKGCSQSARWLNAGALLWSEEGAREGHCNILQGIIILTMVIW